MDYVTSSALQRPVEGAIACADFEALAASGGTHDVHRDGLLPAHMAPRVSSSQGISAVATPAKSRRRYAGKPLRFASNVGF